MTEKLCLFLFCIYSLNFGEIFSVDLTRQPEAEGTLVVDAVVNLIRHTCVFPDDKYFLRRLALVESRDGTSGTTYRAGYYGGIWQVDNNRFVLTKTSAPVQKYFAGIRSEFHIDWTRVTWEDLKKPLYSGLAARLYIEVINNGLENNLPRGVDAQAEYWKNNYHIGSPRASSNFTAIANLFTQECTGKEAIDLVFILDSSGSVDILDFEKAKVFVQKVVDAFTVDWEHTRVAVVKYSSEVFVEFYLDTFRDKQSVLSRIRTINYVSGGTYTAAALNVTVDSVFISSRGARREGRKVAILVTDGASSSFLQTSIAARRARDEAHITMFAVGVGFGARVSELNEVATDPDCMHVFTVGDFGRIAEIKQEIQKASCQSSVIISIGGDKNSTSNTTKPPTVTCDLLDKCAPLAITNKGNDNSTGTSTEGRNVTAVVTRVNCSSATIYASYNNPNPGAAYYEIRTVATEKQPGVIYLNETGKPLYISVQGTEFKLQGSNGTLICVAETSVEEINPKVQLKCIDKGAERKCLPKDLLDFRGELCREPWTFPNPCTKETIEAGKTLFPHPYDSEQYLMCDMAGKAYIVHCPQGELYNPKTQTCGQGATSGGGGKPLDKNITNPCTADAIFSGHLSFPYTPDKHQYIQCDTWGKAWIMDCHEGLVWDEEALMCVVEGHIVPGLLDKSLPNPCTKDNIASNKFFHPYPESNIMYIHCDPWGEAWVMPCNAGFIWNNVAVTCVAGNAT